MKEIKVVESGTGKYLVINDDEKLPILELAIYDVKGLTQTEMNQIMTMIFAKYKLEKGGKDIVR